MRISDWSSGVCSSDLFLVQDPETHTILLFLETVRKHEILADALRRAHSVGKPVIVYKLGRSEQGRALSQSHTGAMAGNDVAIDTFLDRKSTRLNSSHSCAYRMTSSA